jgi:hypothetical protein
MAKTAPTIGGRGETDIGSATIEKATSLEGGYYRIANG